MSEIKEFKHKLDVLNNLNRVMVKSLEELRDAVFKITKEVMDDFEISSEEQKALLLAASPNGDEKIDELILKVKNKKLAGIKRIQKLKFDIEQS